MAAAPPGNTPGSPKVKRRAQPLGDNGIAYSLDETSRKAIEGGRDEVVRAHATHILKACGFPKGARARAACALADTRLYPWIPDPVDVEFIPSPRLMMPNRLTGEEAVYLAEDCDGLSARYAALCLAMGIRCQIVGYSFNAETRKVSHVLVAIWDDVVGEWVDGDPSFQDLPLGTTQKHTWEQRRDLPTMEITCDDVVCDMRRGPNEDEGVVDFVGVGRAPGVDGGSTLGAPSGSSTVGLPSLDDVGREFIAVANDLDAHWGELKTIYDAMRAVFAADGITNVAQLAPYGWSAENQQRAIDLGVMAQLASKYLRDAASGVRSIWVAPVGEPALAQAGLSDIMKERCTKTGGKFDAKAVECACPAGTSFDFYVGCADSAGVAHESTWAIERKPADVFGVELDAGGNPVLVNAQGGPAHAPASPNAIGLGPLAAVGIVAAGAVIYMAVAYAVVKALAAARDIAHTVSETYLDSRVTECYAKDSGVSQEDCDKRVALRRKYELDRLERLALINKTEGDTDPLASLVAALRTVGYVAGAGVTIYAFIKIAEAISSTKKKLGEVSCPAPRPSAACAARPSDDRLRPARASSLPLLPLERRSSALLPRRSA